jgi:hypothetical protein
MVHQRTPYRLDQSILTLPQTTFQGICDMLCTFSVWTECTAPTGKRGGRPRRMSFITRMQELQVSRRGNKWHPRVQIHVGKRAHRTLVCQLVTKHREPAVAATAANWSICNCTAATAGTIVGLRSVRPIPKPASASDKWKTNVSNPLKP